MVLPFDRQPLLHKRYANLSLPVNEKPPKSPAFRDAPPPADDSNGDEYANFLRTLASGERQDDTVSKPKAVTTKPTQGSSPREGVSPRYRPGSSLKGDGLLHVTLLSQQNEKEHVKKMRVIEDHMLQHKQEERELKRAEGDIVKKQHHLRHVMQDYENSVYKKKRGEEVKLSENNNDVEKVKQQQAIQEDRATKARIERNLSASLKVKDKHRKAMIVNTSTEFNYHKVAKQLQLTRNEVARLTTEFELNLKKKEDEEFRLKKELANLAISVNMDSQKKRTMVVEDQKNKKDTTIRDIQDARRRHGNFDEKMKQQGGQGIRYEYAKRRLSRDLINTKDSLSLKNREEGRKMTDVSRRLQYNSTSQRQAKLAAEYLELDRQGKEIEERGQFAEARRSHLLDQATNHRRQQSTQTIAEWKKRYLEKENESSRRVHEDNVKHLQKVVTKLEESEHALYNRVRAAEMQRRKQEQIVARLSAEFDVARRDNARKLKEATVQCQKKEVDLEQKLLRERAELAKLHSQREETIQSLNVQRFKLTSDKYMLAEEEREHNRVARIGQRTDHLEQEVS